MLVRTKILLVKDVLCSGPIHEDELRITALLLQREGDLEPYKVVITVALKDRRGLHRPRDAWMGSFADESTALEALEEKLYDLSRFEDLGFGCHESSEVDHSTTE